MVQGRSVGSVGRIIFSHLLEISLDLLSSVRETVTKDPVVKLDMGRKEEQPMLFCRLFVVGNSCDSLLPCNLGLTTPELGMKLFSLFVKFSDGRSSDHNDAVVVVCDSWSKQDFKVKVALRVLSIHMDDDWIILSPCWGTSRVRDVELLHPRKNKRRCRRKVEFHGWL